MGGEVAGQVSDRVAFAVQLTQLLWAHVDLSARMRVFIVAEDESGYYVGPVAHAWYSPLILHGIDPVGTVEVGYERRARAGSTFGIGLSGGVIWNYRREREESGNQEWKPVVPCSTYDKDGMFHNTMNLSHPRCHHRPGRHRT